MVDLFVEAVPTLIELALELLDPFGGHVVRAVHRAGGEVHKEGPLGVGGPLHLHPLDGVIGEVFSHVVIVTSDVGRHGCRVAIHRGLPLGGLGIQDAVEVIKANTGGPPVKGSRGGLLPQRGEVPLAKGRGGVATLSKNLGDGGRLLRDYGVVPGKDVGRFRDATHVDGVVVTTSQHGGSRGGAQCRGVELVKRESLTRHTIERWRRHGTAEGGTGSKADIVQQNQDDVGGTRRGSREGHRDALGLGNRSPEGSTKGSRRFRNSPLGH